MANEFKVKNGLISYGNIIPEGDFSLGTADAPWKNAHFNETIYLNTLPLSATLDSITGDIATLESSTAKLSANTTVNIGTSGKSTMYLDNAAAVDKGGGLVGLPCTGHSFSAGDSIRVIGGTASVYDNDNYTVHADTTANEIVITATYAAETFAASTVSVYYNQSITATQIQALINAQPKRLGIYTISFEPYEGLYSMNSNLAFYEFVGFISFKNNYDSTELTARKKIRFEFPLNYRITANYNKGFTLISMDIVDTSTTKAPVGLSVTGNERAIIYGCNFKKNAPYIGSSFGIYGVSNTSMIVSQCYIGAYAYGIANYSNNSGFITNCAEQDTPNQPANGIYNSGSLVTTYAPRPAGSIADVTTKDGGYTTEVA